MHNPSPAHPTPQPTHLPLSPMESRAEKLFREIKEDRARFERMMNTRRSSHLFEVCAWPSYEGTPWKTNSYFVAVIYKIIRIIKGEGSIEIFYYDSIGRIFNTAIPGWRQREFRFTVEDYGRRGESLEIPKEMISADITRWRAPVAHPAAQPVNLAELHDPDFSGGLTPSQHLDVVHGGPDPRVASTASPGLPPRVGHVLRLAEIIREVDSRHSLGAAALAEAILAHPGFSGCHDGPVAAPAQGEVAKLVAALEADAECVAAEQPDLMQLTDKQLTRIAELLNGTPHA